MTQLTLFAEPAPVEQDTKSAGPFDHSAWSLAQNPSATRCDRCANWKRSLANYWGQCSARNSYEHEYGGKGCASFAGATTPPHTPDDDSPFCHTCRHFKSKGIPLGKTGGWIGKAGDCAVHGVQVESIATCSEHEWAIS